MTLRREEAQTSGRRAQRMAFGVSVIVCDHRGCREGYLVGIGEGDHLPDDAADDAIASGWSIGDHDYCPGHTAEHADADEVLS